MPLLNYTTEISVHKTLGEIMGLLAAHGARQLLVDYADGDPVAVSFVVPTQFGDRSYRLPARVAKVYQALVRQSQNGKVRRSLVNPQQAARVGWRIVKDWLEAQMAIIESEMASLPEIMLPYMVDGTHHTLYETMVELRLGLPAPDGDQDDGGNDDLDQEG